MGGRVPGVVFLARLAISAYSFGMRTVEATTLKNRLGEVLGWARFERVAITRHGLVVAYLSPAVPEKGALSKDKLQPLTRAEEERLADLCASGDLRPSRWLRAGNPYLLGGLATMLASLREFDRMRLLALAERLFPGMTQPAIFDRWLRERHVDPSRFVPMVRARLQHRLDAR